MNAQDELFDTIENYLNDGMSEMERIAFEEKITQNNALANRVAEVRAANEAIYYASLAELKDTIGQDLKNIKYKEPVNWKKAGTITILSAVVLTGLTTYFVSTYTNKIEYNTSETNKNTIHTDHVPESDNNTSTLTKGKTVDTPEQAVYSAKKEPADLPQNHDKQEYRKADITSKSSEITPTTPPSANTIQSNQSEATKKVETPVLNENKIPCDKSFKINTEASCKEKETGSISIVSDGAYAYTYQLDIQTKTGSKSLFSNLSPGVYDLVVTYGKECAYTKKVYVTEKWCAMNEAYSFNPDYNEKWKPIYESGASGTILIYDKQGKEIYSLPFGSGNEEWIGNDKQGMPASVGVYFAIIHYSDGRKEKVELTIVR